MLKNLDKAPFPWFGGKSRAAESVWGLLGDVPHYVEPFFGSGAVLLGRPHPCNRPYYSETVGDLDGLLCNAWRAIQWYPDEVASAASWPVVEADKQARQIALLRWRESGGLDRLAGDAVWCDPLMAGWWVWAVSVQIGAFSGDGPWTADPVSGRIYRQGRASREPGVSLDRPHLSDNGQGVNRPGPREPGVRRDRPHLTGHGRGVNRPGTREPGVSRDRPHLTGHGQVVNTAAAREPGVSRDLPHLTGDGQGVNRPGTREPGVLDPPIPEHGRSALDGWGAEYHDRTMPELVRWMRHLSARLRHVRVVHGDWSRLVTTGASWTINVRHGDGPCGVFLDPPYADTAERASGLYAEDSLTVAHDVREWCLKWGDHPRYRIVLAGWDKEHESALVDAGWTEHEWYTRGYLTGGMGNIDGSSEQHRERLWASPHCLAAAAADDGQTSLFDHGD